ncbi:MAG TPA: ABC transporter permease [Phycisphaerae bacterium]|mgnify:CR=1 FL=1|nr:ABC transporter permease [Phycisphaerae bacterium]HRR85305.1 ABC transporter permease [Phycisphaerae bacterium]
MSRIWAVARHMIAESIRTKVALLFIAIILIILLTLPFTVTGDGLTIKSRLQNYLAYSLGSVGALLSLLTVFLSCGTLSNEISGKYLFLVVSKPIPRWQLFVGKWVGVVTLNGVMLLVTFAAALASTWYIKNRPATVPGDAEAVQKEVLEVRHNFRLHQPNWNQLAQERLRQLREAGAIEKLSPEEEKALIARLIEEAKSGWRTLRPRQWHLFEFRLSEIAVDRRRHADALEQDYVFLHIKPRHPGGTEDAVLQAVIACGDPREPQTLTREVTADFVVERFHDIPIPTFAVNSRNTLYVQIFNLSDKDSITFEGDDCFELLYPLGTFHWNTLRAIMITWSRLAFLAALGLMMSSFLSFPVACMASFLVLAAASMKKWLADAFEWTIPQGTREDPMWIFGPPMRLIGRAFVNLVPDFTHYDAVSNIVGGRYVPAFWVLQALVLLLLVQGAVLIIIGCVVLTRRELARVTA